MIQLAQDQLEVLDGVAHCNGKGAALGKELDLLVQPGGEIPRQDLLGGSAVVPHKLRQKQKGGVKLCGWEEDGRDAATNRGVRGWGEDTQEIKGEEAGKGSGGEGHSKGCGASKLAHSAGLKGFQGKGLDGGEGGHQNRGRA